MSAPPQRSGKILGYLLALVALGTAGALGTAFYFSSSSIRELLTENRRLNQAIHNLTEERQIGYATVQSQTTGPDNTLRTELRFVQTAPGAPRRIVDEQVFTVRGEVVHFDALIVKFTDAFVKDGKERALYLWRRVYGENTPPSKGQRISEPGESPERYYAITKTLRMQNREVFWDHIWSLADNPGKLSDYGVRAVFGNAIYTRMRPGRVYQFKISPTGQIYPEVVDAR